MYDTLDPNLDVRNHYYCTWSCILERTPRLPLFRKPKSAVNGEKRPDIAGLINTNRSRSPHILCNTPLLRIAHPWSVKNAAMASDNLLFIFAFTWPFFWCRVITTLRLSVIDTRHQRFFYWNPMTSKNVFQNTCTKVGHLCCKTIRLISDPLDDQARRGQSTTCT